MAEFNVNATTRIFPYPNFKFLVWCDNEIVLGCSKISPLKQTIEVIKHRCGGDPSTPRKSPGRAEYEAITIERGLTQNPVFDRWAKKVWMVGQGLGSEVSLRDFRKDFTIQVLNEAGQVALAYKVYRAWPSEYQILGEMDANANAVAIQHLKLECEGWERDYEVPEPLEPTYQIP